MTSRPQQGQLEESSASFRHAIELDPDFAQAHHNLGGVYRDQGELEPAGRAVGG